MEYVVEQSKEIDFGATGLAAILQNVRTIMTTVAGTVPLNRALGVDGSAVDAPIPIAQARLTSAIVDAIQLYENRVQVVSVIFQENHGNGSLSPIVTVRLREGVSL